MIDSSSIHIEVRTIGGSTSNILTVATEDADKNLICIQSKCPDEGFICHVDDIDSIIDILKEIKENTKVASW